MLTVYYFQNQNGRSFQDGHTFKITLENGKISYICANNADQVYRIWHFSPGPNPELGVSVFFREEKKILSVFSE